MAKVKATYGADSIQKLDYPDNVRKRPTMYIGHIGHLGLVHLLKEVTDNSIDEALNGYASQVVITLNEDGSISVADDGRGIPVGINKETGNDALTMVFTELHAGGKFDENDDSYKISSGLNGVGAAVVNAISARLHVEVHRDGYYWTQTFKKGLPKTEVIKQGKSKEHGTIVTFKPDSEVLGEDMGAYDFKDICHMYQERSYLNTGLQITIEDEATNKSKTYCSKDGLKDYVKHLSPENIIGDIIRFTGEDKGVSVEVAMTWNNSYDETSRLFCNTIKMSEGGTPVSGFRFALSKLMTEQCTNLFPKAAAVTGEDTREGLVCIISVKHPNPEYAGQHKSQLGNKDAQTITQRIVSDGLQLWLSQNPAKAKILAKKISDAATARTAARKAKEQVRAKQKDGVFSLNSISKLTDCISKDPKICELHVVEGESAGGSAKNGRDKNTQAIYALKGKPLNTEGVRVDVMYANKEISDLINVIGTGIGIDFDIEKLKYHKIIIESDADVDGLHIAILLMGTIFRNMKPLIENGHVYLAAPPLFRIVEGKDKVSYIRDGAKLNAYIAKRFMSKGDIIANGEFNNFNLTKLLKSIEIYSKKLNILSSAMGSPIEFVASIVESSEVESAKELRKAIAGGLGSAEIRGTTVLGDTGLGFVSAVVTDKEVHLFQSTQAAFLNAAKLIGECEPPFKIKFNDKSESVSTLYELGELVNKFAKNGINIGYLKGLGEMTDEQLWDTTLNPETRTLHQLKVEDFDDAGEMITALLGGGTNGPALRRDFMEDNVNEYPREILDI
jgi:DNA gyrase subunit B